MKLWAVLIVTYALQTTFVSTGTVGPKGELSQNRPRCDEKRGRCIPVDAPCRGRAMICCDYCRDEDNYKCCIDMCYTYQPCSSLGGSCLSQHQECHGIGVNVENGCSVENSLNCTCCVPHSKKAFIKDWEKANEKTPTFAKASNQISPYTKKNSRTGKDLRSEIMEELENKLINEKAVLMEENGDLMDDLLSEEETLAEDEVIIGSNEFSVDQNEFLEQEKRIINYENGFSSEENELEDENNELIGNNDDLSSEVEEIIAENVDFYESNEEIEGNNNILKEGVSNDNIDVEDDNEDGENTAVDNNEDNILLSSNEELDNDYSFNEDENEQNEVYSVHEVDEDADNIEYDDYEHKKVNEDTKNNDETEGNVSTRADKTLEYEED